MTRFPDWAARMMQDEGELVRSASDLANQTREAALRERFTNMQLKLRGCSKPEQRRLVIPPLTNGWPKVLAQSPRTSPSPSQKVRPVVTPSWNSATRSNYNAGSRLNQAISTQIFWYSGLPMPTTSAEPLPGLRRSSRVLTAMQHEGGAAYAAAKCMNSLAVGFISVGDLAPHELSPWRRSRSSLTSTEISNRKLGGSSTTSLHLK